MCPAFLGFKAISEANHVLSERQRYFPDQPQSAGRARSSCKKSTDQREQVDGQQD